MAEVWLYGSVARGDARPGSDIDLVAVFDDTEYRGRHRTKAALEQAARKASDRWVEVLVTDRAEWRIQREQVSASFTSAISSDLMLLTCTPNTSDQVDWGKQQVMATSNEELALERLRATLMNVRKIDASRGPSWAERDLAGSDDRVEYEEVRGVRLIMVCEASHLVVENAAKAVAVLSGVDAELLWSHDVAEIIKALGAEDAQALGALVEAAPGLVKSPDYITMWRTRGSYGTSTEGMTAQEVATPAFASTVAVIACDAAVYAAKAVSRLIGARRAEGVPGELRHRAETLRQRLADHDLATGRAAATPTAGGPSWPTSRPSDVRPVA